MNDRNVMPFVVRHYSFDERPCIKGNGFDGLAVGETREEAEEFVTWLNAKLAAPSAPAAATDSNLVTLDKRDLFCTVRSAIKDAIQTDESYAADDWSRAHDLAVACLLPLIGEAPPAPAAEKRQGLTDEQIHAIDEKHRDKCGDDYVIDFARAIEKAHSIPPADAKEGK